MVTSTRDIEMLVDGKLHITNAKGKKAGYIVFNQLTMDMRPSLVEYLGHGWKLDVSIAIDFTLSNLEITDYRSLHKVNRNGDMN